MSPADHVHRHDDAGHDESPGPHVFEVFPPTESYFLCPECGPRVAVDEDGLCAGCGSMTFGNREEWYVAALAEARREAWMAGRDAAIDDLPPSICRLFPLLKPSLRALRPPEDRGGEETWETLLSDYHKWVAETIPHARQAAGLKVREEMEEFIAAPSPEEAADVALCLFNYAEQEGFDLLAAVRAKHEKNKARTWARTADGVWKHVPAETCETETPGLVGCPDCGRELACSVCFRSPAPGDAT